MDSDYVAFDEEDHFEIDTTSRTSVLGLAFAAPRQRSKQRVWCSNYCRQEGPKVVLMCLWTLANLGLFIERFLYYRLNVGVRPQAAFQMMGYGVCFARGAANALKLNLMMVLLLACRNFIGWAERSQKMRLLMPLHKLGTVFHKYTALAILIWTAIHVAAHVSNAVHIGRATTAAQFGFMLAPPAQLPFNVLFTRTGITGIVAVVTMSVMMLLALQKVRRTYFEVFQYSHLICTLVFFSALLTHSENLLEPPILWAWVGVGGGAYLVDRIFRWIKTYHHVRVLSCDIMPGGVRRLRFQRPRRFRYQAGDYVRICVPELSRLQYHPFTLTSSDEASFSELELHISEEGNWTRALGICALKEISLQGPFSTSSAGILGGEFSVVMCVGGGVGVTPFASVLRTISSRLENVVYSENEGMTGGGGNMPLKYAEFVWTSRDASSFTWFEDIINELGARDRLIVSTYHTGKNKGAAPEVTNGVVKKGRPKWDEHFARLRKYAGRGKIGIFVCGGRGLQHALYNECRKRDKCVFHKEVFG